MKISRTHIGYLFRRHISRVGKSLLLAGCVLTVTLVSGQAYRAAGASYGVSSFPKIQGCPINQRFSNWDMIIKDGASFGDFAENWADLFTRNSCQQNDIFAIEKQIEGTQNELRQQIFKCQAGEQVTTLQQKLYELEFELEYLRNIMDTNDENPGPGGAKAVVFHPDKVMALMQESTLVQKGYISSDRMNQLFADFQKKYETRSKDYANCKDSDWAALSVKWNDFVNNWAGLKPAVTQAAKTTATQFNQILETPSDRTGNFVNGFLDVRVNNVTPQQNFANMYRQLSGYDSKPGAVSNGTPDTAKVPPTSWTFLDRIQNEYNRYTSDTSQAERRTRYEALYQHVSDAAGVALVGEIKNMNRAIETTLPFMTQSRACVRKIAMRECGGK